MARLLVRSPSVATRDDFSVCVPLGGRISDVKAAIESGHEASPSARDMRIIWKGRILEDSDPVKAIYDSERATGVQTLHFVLSTPVAQTSPAAGPGSQSVRGTGSHTPTQRRHSHSHDGDGDGSSSDGGEGSPLEATAAAADEGNQPTVVPIGRMFQYVLVNGVPHLLAVEQPATSLGDAQSSEQHERRPAPGERAERVRAFEALCARFQEQHRALQQELELMRERIVNTRRGNNEALDNTRQLAGMLQGVGFSAVWSFCWLLLRMLLVVLVIAHDASLERVFALACVITAVAILRSSWLRQQMRALRRPEQAFGGQGRHEPQPPPEQGAREYSALEKARALLVALVTSLVPAEPFQLPAGDE
ncbi:hypothetical protein LPJ61_003623 [Coemansia biformis]|uniref:Ubiquitin-like domain-containing protein n=1 Tax=Coemansia biformis TaxID=1286918 RepID=A0A9W8CYF7_9FUNG|nr:hypothetical protein LPJ61_003623 [Coemansia biformis]